MQEAAKRGLRAYIFYYFSASPHPMVLGSIYMYGKPRDILASIRIRGRDRFNGSGDPVLRRKTLWVSLPMQRQSREGESGVVTRRARVTGAIQAFPTSQVDIRVLFRTHDQF